MFIPLGLIVLMVVFGMCPKLTSSDSIPRSGEETLEDEENMSNEGAEEIKEEAPESPKERAVMPVLSEPKVIEEEIPEVQPIVPFDTNFQNKYFPSKHLSNEEIFQTE